MKALPLLVLGVAGCAKLGPPSGGEVDRVSPTVVDTWPHADATSVGPDQVVAIEFSEGMDRRHTEDALFITPHTTASFRWRGSKLEIRPGDGLQPGQTYVVTVGSDARDLRGNRLDQSFTVAFATGEQLDSGHISGRVFRRAEPAAAVHVWAYDMTRFSGTVGKDPPAYRTQTGVDGTYEFQRLATGRFRIFAFDDADKNGEYDAGEALAVPSRDVELAEEEKARAADLALTDRRAAAPRLTRAQSLNASSVLLVFDSAVEVRDVAVSLKGLLLRGMYGNADGKRVYIMTSTQESGKTYSLSDLTIKGERVQWSDSADRVDAIRGSGRADRKPPTLQRRAPSGFAVADDSLRIVFSEAMKPLTIRGDFWIASDSTLVLDGEWTWHSANELVFVPSSPMAAVARRLEGRLDDLADVAGNACADSTVTFQFEVVDALELSGISGGAFADDATRPRVVDGGRKPIRVTATAADRRAAHTLADSTGSYAIEGLLPGSYRVSAYEDDNENEFFDDGMLDPFVAAEPYSAHGEVVSLSRGGSAESVDLELR